MEEPPPPPPPPPPSHHLQITTTQLTNLLTNHLPLTHHFKSKWSLIRTKLTQLQTHIADLSETPHSLSSYVITSLSETLTSAEALVGKCTDPDTITDGKLQTQSELNSLYAKLDQHVKDCQVLITSGVVSSPVGPGREVVRARVRELLTRFQIGSVECKKIVIDELLALILDDDKNVMIAVAQGVVPVLVRSIDSSSCGDVRDKITAVLARVSSVDSSKSVLLAEGLLLLNNLIRVVESGSVYGKEKACVVLESLSNYRENARAIGCRGGICSLLEICHCGTPTSQGVAAGVLRNLARFEEIKENFVEENGVHVLVSLAGSGTALAKENAIGCLSNLVLDDNTMKVLVARVGGVEILKNYWDSSLIGKGLEPAVELLRNLGSYHPIGEVLIHEGFPTRLMPLLNCGVLALRIGAANAVYELGFCSKARKEMGELGGVSSLVRMLDGKAVQERESATKALSILLQCSYNRKLFKKEERGIVSTVQLLDPLTMNLDKKWSISVLSTMIQSKKCRKQMVGAGACVYIQKLVELDVEGAKKLLESLGRGKLWGVFARP